MDYVGVVVAGITAAVGISGAAYALNAIGLNLQFGYAGLINFGHVAFMLVGAYGFAITADLGGPTWLGVIVGLLAAVLLALVIGVPTLRLRGDYLAIVTIAGAEILRLLANSTWLEPLTNGPRGIQSAGGDVLDINPIPAGRYGIETIDIGIWEGRINLLFNARDLWMMLITWTLVAISTVLVFRLVRSPWGRVLKAIRDDEDAVRSVGKNVFRYKQQALILGGLIGALAGIVLAIERQNVVPSAYQPVITFWVYAMVILGGAGSVMGPIVGSLVFWFLFQGSEVFMSQAVEQGWFGGVIENIDVGAVRYGLVGVALVVLMIFRSQGIFGSKREQAFDAA